MRFTKAKRPRILMVMLLALILFFLLLELVFRPFVPLQALAEQLYKYKRYKTAERLLSRNAIKDKGIANANLAKTLYKQQRYNEADSLTVTALQQLPKASVYYDKGNSEYQQKNYEEAQKSYRKALLADPNDLDAKANFELTLRKLQQQPTPPPQQKQEDKRKKEEIDNILGGLDNKESSDRKQNRVPSEPQTGKWW